MTFSFRGQDERGVPCFTGEDDPERWFWRVFALTGAGFGLAGAIGGIFSVLGSISGNSGAGLTVLLLLSVPGYVVWKIGTWWLCVCQDLPRLQTAAEMAKRFGMSESEAAVLVTSLSPRLNLNGADLYDPAGFGETARLLRAVDPPDFLGDRLLRAVGHGATPPEQLPRPVDGEHS